MDYFKAFKLEFICRSETTVHLPRYNGPTLRGAFFGALRHDFCLNKNLPSCLNCPAAEACPICRLVATVEREGERGVEVPRPFALQPVLADNPVFDPGQTFSFGITLFGNSLALFPYIILAVQRMGEIGMGNRAVAPGRFSLRGTRVSNPFTGQEKEIYSAATRMVSVPDITITHRDILAYAGRLNPRSICLELLTPLRLIKEGSLVQKLSFQVFMQRLLRRLTDLHNYYCDQTLEMDFAGILQRAAEVRMSKDTTCWVDRASYSSRRQTSTPVGGLTGTVEFEGDLREFLPLLAWGRITQLGKDVTKGNGLYSFREAVKEKSGEVTGGKGKAGNN